MYYNSEGELVAIGAEAVREGIEEEAIENGWSKAEWFVYFVIVTCCP